MSVLLGRERDRERGMGSGEEGAVHSKKEGCGLTDHAEEYQQGESRGDGVDYTVG